MSTFLSYFLERKLFYLNNFCKKFTAANIDESCYFHEQCLGKVPETECRDGLCSCVFDKIPRLNDDNTIECIGNISKYFLPIQAELVTVISKVMKKEIL